MVAPKIIGATSSEKGLVADVNTPAFSQRSRPTPASDESEQQQRAAIRLMSRGAHSFKQGDLTKAIKAVVKAGVRVGRVEIADGKIIVVVGRPYANAADVLDDLNEWDSVK